MRQAPDVVHSRPARHAGSAEHVVSQWDARGGLTQHQYDSRQNRINTMDALGRSSECFGEREIGLGMAAQFGFMPPMAFSIWHYLRAP